MKTIELHNYVVNFLKGKLFFKCLTLFICFEEILHKNSSLKKMY